MTSITEPARIATTPEDVEGLVGRIFIEGVGAMHLGNGGEDFMGIAAAALIGFFFCLTLWRTGNLWWAVGFHMSFDWGETFLFSVPNSGNVAPGHRPGIKKTRRLPRRVS